MAYTTDSRAEREVSLNALRASVKARDEFRSRYQTPLERRQDALRDRERADKAAGVARAEAAAKAEKAARKAAKRANKAAGLRVELEHLQALASESVDPGERAAYFEMADQVGTTMLAKAVGKSAAVAVDDETRSVYVRDPAMNAAEAVLKAAQARAAVRRALDIGDIESAWTQEQMAKAFDRIATILENRN